MKGRDVLYVVLIVLVALSALIIRSNVSLYTKVFGVILLVVGVFIAAFFEVFLSKREIERWKRHVFGEHRRFERWRYDKRMPYCCHGSVLRDPRFCKRARVTAS